MKTGISKTTLYELGKGFVVSLLEGRVSVRLSHALRRTDGKTVLLLAKQARIEGDYSQIPHEKRDSAEFWLEWIQELEDMDYRELTKGFPVGFGKKTLAEFMAAVHHMEVFLSLHQTGLLKEE